jgi:hypothetical protein
MKKELFKKTTKPAAKKTPAKVAKPAEKVYKDYFDVQKNAPRKLGTIAKTAKGASYKLEAVTPPVWKKVN